MTHVYLRPQNKIQLCIYLLCRLYEPIHFYTAKILKLMFWKIFRITFWTNKRMKIEVPRFHILYEILKIRRLKIETLSVKFKFS